MHVTTQWGGPCSVMFCDVKIHSCHLDSTLHEPQKISSGTMCGPHRARPFPQRCATQALNALICPGEKQHGAPTWGGSTIIQWSPRRLRTYILIIAFQAVNMPRVSAPIPLSWTSLANCRQQSDHQAMAYEAELARLNLLPFYKLERMGVGYHHKQTGKDHIVCISFPPPH